MPTTPNPYPPVEPDPVPGQDPQPQPQPVPVPNDPDAPSGHDNTKPDILDRLVVTKREELNYQEHFFDSHARSTEYINNNVIQYPGYEMFNTWCPGHYSRRYTSKSDAASLASGSGYFGYPAEGVFGSAGWWSTNFVDYTGAVRAPAEAIKSEGKYYSKNTVLAGAHVLMGVCTVDDQNVSLKWGAMWGIASKNAWYDNYDPATNVVTPKSYTLPRLIDGTVDMEMVEHEIMSDCPTYGCFVILDLYRNRLVYCTVDGDPEQFAVGSTGSGVSTREPFVEGIIPPSSKLVDLPVMPKHSTGWTPGKDGTSITRDTQDMGAGTYLAVNDRTKPWMVFADGAVIGGWVPQTNTLLNAQSINRFPMVVQSKSEQQNPYNAVIASPDSDMMWYPDSNFITYSGFLVVGTATQCVGQWSPNSYNNQGGTIVCSAYGVSSICSGEASVDNQKTALVPSPGGVEGIAKLCPSFVMAFIYDAAVGDYGQVTWISMV